LLEEQLGTLAPATIFRVVEALRRSFGLGWATVVKRLRGLVPPAGEQAVEQREPGHASGSPGPSIP
jgi:hypothetical protein